MKITLGDAQEAVEGFLSRLGPTEDRTPEWESHHLSEMLSQMDTIASTSLTQIASVDVGGGAREVQHAFASLANVEPQDEFQAAMFQYARASLQLLQSLRLCPPPEESTIGAGSPSTVTMGTMLGANYSPSALDDVSKVNLLHSLTEYTDSRLNLASFTSFPSTPFEGTRSASLTRSCSGESDRSPQDRGVARSPQEALSWTKEVLKRDRPSMCSRHLLNTIGRYNSTFSTQQSNDTVFEHPGHQDYPGHQDQASGLRVPTYEALEAAGSPESSATLTTVRYKEPSGHTILSEAAVREESRWLPGRRETVVGPLDIADTLDTPGTSHAHNTAFCKALALQAIRDLSPRLCQPEGKAPRLRPLGGSSSMRASHSEVKPRVRRRHTSHQESLYMTYRAPSSGLPPPKPAKNFSSETLHARLSSLYLYGDIDCSDQVHGSFTTVQQRPKELNCASPKPGSPSFLKKAISLFRPRSLKHKTAKPQTVNHINYDYTKCKTL